MPITPREGLDPHLNKQEETMQDTVPSGHHTWAELLRLVGAVRQLAFDTSLPPIEAMGRIRDVPPMTWPRLTEQQSEHARPPATRTERPPSTGVPRGRCRGWGRGCAISASQTSPTPAAYARTVAVP